jgi:hypothetical protein
MEPIAEVAFDIAGFDEKAWARLFAPQPCEGDWTCTFEIDAPIDVKRTVYGVSSMQALVLGLKTLASYLYGSDAYRNKQLGIGGDFGGNLFVPAPAEFLSEAPYSF